MISRAVGDARATLEFSQRYNAGNTDYVREQQSYLAQFQALQSNIAQIGTATVEKQGGNLDLAMVQQLLNALQRVSISLDGNTKTNTSKDNNMSTLINLLVRDIANRPRGTR